MWTLRGNAAEYLFSRYFSVFRTLLSPLAHPKMCQDDAWKLAFKKIGFSKKLIRKLKHLSNIQFYQSKGLLNMRFNGFWGLLSKTAPTENQL